MAIGDINKRVIATVSMKTGEAEGNLRTFTKQSIAAKLGLKDLGTEAKRAEAAMGTIGLGAGAQLTGLQKLGNVFQGVTGKIGVGIGGVSKFAQALGPWNQALELGGKALKFAEAGLDAYAKTSKEAAKDVEDLKNEFSGLKDAVMAGVGAITVETLKAIPSLKQLEVELGKVQKAAKSIDETKFLGALGNFNDALIGTQAVDGFTNMKDAAKDFFDTTLGGINRFGEVDNALDLFKKKSDEVAAANKRATEAAKDRWKAELAAFGALSTSAASGKGLTDDLVKSLESDFAKSDDFTSRQFGSNEAQLSDFAINTSATGGAKEKKPTLLEGLGLEDPSQLSFALSAVQSFTTGYTAALQALGEGTVSAGKAFKLGLGIIVHGIGDKLAAMSAAEAVEGAAMLLTLNPKGALHLGAAAILAGGAVAAYAGAAKLGAGGGSAPSAPASGGGGGSAGTGSSSSGGGSVSTGGQQQGPSERVIVWMGDPFGDDSPRMRQIKGERAIDAAFGTARR